MISAGNQPLRLRKPLRFVHASDLHLDRTVEGVGECPAFWEQRFLDVSRRAAAALFQKALEEQVEFLILSGNVFNASLASPGTVLFLWEQFERLKKAGIAVYWAGGEFDSPEDLPAAFPLPDNVHPFPSSTIQEYYFNRLEDGETVPVAKIAGISRNQQNRRVRTSDFPLDPGGLFTIAAANGDIVPETLTQKRIDYWAMGGLDQRQVFHGNPRKKGLDGKPVPLDLPNTAAQKRNPQNLPPLPYTVHYPGSTVARSPKDIGLYGATLIEVPFGEEPVLTYFATSPVRWVNDQITMKADDDGGQLADIVRERIRNYRETQKDGDLLISWYVDVPPGALANQLRRGTLAHDIVTELRSLYGKEEPLTWAVSLSLLLPEYLPKTFYEQQTILGDFVRSVKHFQDNPQDVLDLEGYIPKQWGTSDGAATLLLSAKETADENNEHKVQYHRTEQQKETQRQVLQEAAVVGVELLGTDVVKTFALDPYEEK
ncbi:MAG: metallophosphoesterase [Planctomycetaceae bacterium]|jgi:hypothetical protein|nr:metallophosphoesterase [Planctomycetaceae bacterium]